MLVLSRKTNESVLIGDGIEVIVIGIQGNRVRLGFIAPESLKINRKEVWLQLADDAARDESLELSDASAA